VTTHDREDALVYARNERGEWTIEADITLPEARTDTTPWPWTAIGSPSCPIRTDKRYVTYVFERGATWRETAAIPAEYDSPVRVALSADILAAG